jgi:hypothetical protein
LKAKLRGDERVSRFDYLVEIIYDICNVNLNEALNTSPQ